jgi:hypothetical protein
VLAFEQEITEKEMKKNDLMLRSVIENDIINGKFNDLIEFLDECLKNGNNEILVSANIILARPDNLAALIKMICSNPERLAKTVEASYHHENGFHKIVLLTGKYFKLRLHHFGATTMIPMENIHDHRWCFSSTILSGELKMDLFTVVSKATETEELYHFKYDSKKINGQYQTQFISQAHLKIIESRSYQPGDTYLMMPHELHRIRSTPGQESVTMILTGKPVNRKCNLYSKRMILEAEKQTIQYKTEVLTKMLISLAETIYPQNN